MVIKERLVLQNKNSVGEIPSYKHYNELVAIWSMYLNKEKATVGEYLVKLMGNFFSLALDHR